MASINVEPNGRRMIQFVARDGKRKTIRLGKVSQRDAERVRTRVEQLVTATFGRHALEPDTAAWLAELDGPLREKLVRVGLAKPLEEKVGPATLQVFLDGYIAKRKDVKRNTLIVWGHVRRNLIEFFGAKKPLRDVTPGDADDWKRWLASDQGLGSNTICKRCQFAKMFFRAAVKHRLLDANPFAEIRGKVQGNPSRAYFVTEVEAVAVLDACPDAQWAIALRAFPLRRPALPQRAPGAAVGRHRLGTESHDGPLAEDRAPSRRRVASRSALPGTPALPGRMLRPRRTGDRARHHALSGRQREPADAASADHRSGGPATVAQAVPQPAEHPADGARGIIPVARRLRVAGEFGTDRPPALPPSDRRALRSGSRGAAKSDAAGARNGTQDYATCDHCKRKNPGKSGVCETAHQCSKQQSGG
ncbi:MAG: phage integrase SAM-like domain-containing protein [Planctomycetales bacterium]